MFFQGHQAEIKQQKIPSGNSIQESVRRNLSEDVEEEDGARNLFLLGDEAVPSLINFLYDSNKAIRVSAARGLAYIGNQEGMQALRIAVKAERDKETKSAISCFLAGGLVGTKSESDLHFLRSSVERADFAGNDEKDFPAFCAALALGMIGRSDSLPILRKAVGADSPDSEEIGKAILWMENKSVSGQVTTGPPSSNEELIKRFVLDDTFFAARERDKTSVENVAFNHARIKVLVSLEIYLNPKSARGYDLVLAKEDGVWRVTGIWFAWIA
jgi:hypothetical protein